MSQGQKSPHEDIILTIIAVGLILTIAWGIWHFFHAELTNALRWIRVAELWLATFVVHADYAVNVPDQGVQQMSVWRKWLPHAPVEQIGTSELRVMTYVTMMPLRYVFSAVMGFYMAWAIFFGPGTRYKRKMRLEELMKEQAISFPQIQPFVKFNPLTQVPHRVPGDPVPSKLPMFAEALSPEEWVAYHDIAWQNNQLDTAKAWQGLAQQLGKRWQGPLKLAPHAQALYAVFALKHARKRKEAEQMLNELAVSWTPEGGLNIPPKLKSQIMKIIRDPKLGGALQKHADKHAFETTALLRALGRAREEGGVLAPATFLWLRGQDRTLWYPLNNMGRKSYHAEAVGAMVHYTNELIAGQKIPTPRFDDVIRGIEGFLKGPSSRAIPPREKKK